VLDEELAAAIEQVPLPTAPQAETDKNHEITRALGYVE
jgi:hypothetical protein